MKILLMICWLSCLTNGNPQNIDQINISRQVGNVFLMDGFSPSDFPSLVTAYLETRLKSMPSDGLEERIAGINAHLSIRRTSSSTLKSSTIPKYSVHDFKSLNLHESRSGIGIGLLILAVGCTWRHGRATKNALSQAALVLVVSSLADAAQAANCTAPPYEAGDGITPGEMAFSTISDIDDLLNSCETFFGSVFINLIGITTSVHIDRIKNITGFLKIGPVYFPENREGLDNQSSLSMNSLVSVGEEFSVSMDYLSHIDMPNLAFVGINFEISSTFRITPLEALDLPLLAAVGGRLMLHDLHMATTINLAALTSVGTLEIKSLPALTTLSLDSGIRVIGVHDDMALDLYGTDYSIAIQNTALTSLDGLYISNTTNLHITDNSNLDKISLFSLDSRALAFDVITRPKLFIRDNGLELAVNISELTSYAGDIDFHLTRLSVPDLQNADALLISGNVTSFDANKLKNTGSLWIDNIDGHSTFSKLDLPLLETVGDFLLRAGNFSKGALSMPNLVSMVDFSYHGASSSSAAFCQEWSNKRCLGFITGDFSCGKYIRVPILRDAQKCKNYWPASGFTLAKNLKFGIGIGVGVPIAIAVCFWVWRCRKAKRPVQQLRNAVELVDLPEEEQLPKYQQHDTEAITPPEYGQADRRAVS